MLALHRRHAVDIAAHRLERRMIHGHHAAVIIPHDRPRFTCGCIRTDRKQLLGAFHHVHVRVFLVADDRGGVVQHLLCQVTMRVQLQPDCGIRPDDLTHTGHHVTLAVIITLGDHRAMHRHQNHIDRHRGPQVIQNVIAHGLIDLAHCWTGRLGVGCQPFGDLPPQRFGPLAPDSDGRRIKPGLSARCSFGVQVFLEPAPPGWNGRE